MSRTAVLAACVLAFIAVVAAAQDCPELVGRGPYGPAYAVAVSGDHVYFHARRASLSKTGIVSRPPRRMSVRVFASFS